MECVISPTEVSKLKILIVNVHSAQNKGDAALVKMAINILQKVFPWSSVTIAANDPESFVADERKVGSLIYWMHKVSAKGYMQWRHGVVAKMLLASLWALITYKLFGQPCFVGLQQKQKETLQVYFDSDLVVSAPGNFLYSSGKFGLTFILVAYTMAYAILAGKPLYLLPQSIGPLYRERDRKLLRWVLERARIVMVREPISLEEIHRAGVRNPRCYIMPDLAFAFQGASREEAINWLRIWGVDPEAERPLLGVTTINWGARTGNEELQSRYEEALAAATSYYLDKFGGTVLYFPQVCSKALVNDDRVPAKRIVERLGESRRVILVEETLSPELLKAIYGLMDVFIGTRMHSNIFALSNGVPVIAIAYLHKTQGIMQMLGLDRWVIDIKEITPEKLIDKLIDLWQERERVRYHIQAEIACLVKQIDLVGLHIASDFTLLANSNQ
jgi:colanic acid/amylovoran biosynthesis protein